MRENGRIRCADVQRKSYADKMGGKIITKEKEEKKKKKKLLHQYERKRLVHFLTHNNKYNNII